MNKTQAQSFQRRLRDLLNDLLARKGIPAASPQRKRRANDLALINAVAETYELDEQDKRRVGDWLADECNPSAVHLIGFARKTGVSLNWLLDGGKTAPFYNPDVQPWSTLADELANHLRSAVLTAAERADYWHRRPKADLLPNAFSVDVRPWLTELTERAIAAFREYYIALFDAATDEDKAQAAGLAVQHLRNAADQYVAFMHADGKSAFTTYEEIEREIMATTRYLSHMDGRRPVVDHLANTRGDQSPVVLTPVGCADAFGGSNVDYHSSQPGARFHVPDRTLQRLRYGLGLDDQDRADLGIAPPVSPVLLPEPV